jgi:hypothetical protein
MEQARKQVVDYLLQDVTLLNMLAKNRKWWQPQSNDLENRNSIVPLLDQKMDYCPYLMVRYVAEHRQGYHLDNAFLAIRCYTSLDKSYYEIDMILSRVKLLLHRHTFTFDAGSGQVNTDTFYEMTGAELVDQGFQQRFREQQYKLQNI